MTFHIWCCCFFYLSSLEKNCYMPSTSVVSILFLSSISAWLCIISLQVFSKFQQGQNQKCPHFHSSHQITLSNYSATQTPSAFSRCWKEASWCCSRGSVKSSILFARWPHRRGSEPMVTSLSEWWNGNHCCLCDKISLCDDETPKQAWAATI